MNSPIPTDAAANAPETPLFMASAESGAGQAAAPLAAGSQRALWLIAALAVMGLVVGGVVWQKVTGMQEILARQSAESQKNSAEAYALAKQAVSLAQETAARAAVLDSRLSEVALQRVRRKECRDAAVLHHGDHARDGGFNATGQARCVLSTWCFGRYRCVGGLDDAKAYQMRLACVWRGPFLAVVTNCLDGPAQPVG